MKQEQNLDKPEIISNFAFGVDPDKIGEIAILMVQDRTQHYKGAFDEVLHKLRGGVFHGITGLIEGKTVSAIYSKGPGDIADCVAYIAMSKTKCHTIFSTGSTGGLGKEVEISDFVLVDSAVGNDSYSQFLEKQNGTCEEGFFGNIQYPHGKATDLTLEAVKKVAKEYGVQTHKGKIFTTPGVSLETNEFLKEIVDEGCIAIDMETAQFYAACKKYNIEAVAVHWVTDLPLTRNFFYRFHHPKEAQQDFEKKHPVWLNMANILTAIVRGYIEKL